MGKQTIPFAYLAEELDSNGETILTGKLGRARLVGRLLKREDGGRLWSIALTETDVVAKNRRQYAKRKKLGEA